ncbi:unnamed protein product [Ectocarpus fasciculatus]
MALVDGCVMIPRQTSLLAQEHTYDDGVACTRCTCSSLHTQPAAHLSF